MVGGWHRSWGVLLICPSHRAVQTVGAGRDPISSSYQEAQAGKGVTAPTAPSGRLVYATSSESTSPAQAPPSQGSPAPTSGHSPRKASFPHFSSVEWHAVEKDASVVASSVTSGPSYQPGLYGAPPPVVLDTLSLSVSWCSLTPLPTSPVQLVPFPIPLLKGTVLEWTEQGAPHSF